AEPVATPEFQVDFGSLIEDRYYEACGSPNYHDLYKVYCIAEQEGYSYHDIIGYLPHPVYVSGPHGSSLNMRSRTEFGHHNPQLLTWLEQQIDSQLGNPLVITATRGGYEKNLQHSVHLYSGLRTYMQQNGPERFQLAVENYRSRVDDGVQPDAETASSTLSRDIYPIWGDFVRSGTVADADHRETHLAIMFWARREIDGTADQWFRILQKIRNHYDRQ
ncbi:MAG: hypothetical protein QGG40_09620, partial [Myxococcota bacterium]|nr:hypothetical protein [Myxococcota bacterium]